MARADPRWLLGARQPRPRTYLLGHGALPLRAGLFWTFTGNPGRLYLGWEDVETTFPKLPLSMVEASETLHPAGRGRAGPVGLPPNTGHPRRPGLASSTHLPRFSWVMTEGGGLALSVPPGQKLLVIHVTFSSTTCTWEEGKWGPQLMVWGSLSGQGATQRSPPLSLQSPRM